MRTEEKLNKKNGARIPREWCGHRAYSTAALLEALAGSQCFYAIKLNCQMLENF